MNGSLQIYTDIDEFTSDTITGKHLWSTDDPIKQKVSDGIIGYGRFPILDFNTATVFSGFDYITFCREKFLEISEALFIFDFPANELATESYFKILLHIHTKLSIYTSEAKGLESIVLNINKSRKEIGRKEHSLFQVDNLESNTLTLEGGY